MKTFFECLRYCIADRGLNSTVPFLASKSLNAIGLFSIKLLSEIQIELNDARMQSNILAGTMRVIRYTFKMYRFEFA